MKVLSVDEKVFIFLEHGLKINRIEDQLIRNNLSASILLRDLSNAFGDEIIINVVFESHSTKIIEAIDKSVLSLLALP